MDSQNLESLSHCKAFFFSLQLFPPLDLFLEFLSKQEHTMSPTKEREGKENAQTRLLIHVGKQIPPKWQSDIPTMH